MRNLILVTLFLVAISSCKKKEEETPAPTIFEGFENRSFYDTLSIEIVNYTWTTYDKFHAVQNRVYFRGDGQLYVKYNYPVGGEYTYNGSFNLTGNYIDTEHYGDYHIDKIYLNKTPVIMELVRNNGNGNYDTTSFYRDSYIVK